MPRQRVSMCLELPDLQNGECGRRKRRAAQNGPDDLQRHTAHRVEKCSSKVLATRSLISGMAKVVDQVLPRVTQCERSRRREHTVSIGVSGISSKNWRTAGSENLYSSLDSVMACKDKCGSRRVIRRANPAGVCRTSSFFLRSCEVSYRPSSGQQ